MSREPWFAAPSPCPPGPIAIIGSGIAGACLAHALTKRGRDVTLFDTEPAGGASGNPAGLVMPRLDADDGPVAQFYRDAFLFALSFYASRGAAFDPCGGTIATDPAKIEGLKARNLWPEQALRYEADHIAIDQAGVLRPREAVLGLIKDLRQIKATVVGVAKHDDLYAVKTDAEIHDGFAGIVWATGAAYQARHAEEVRPSLGQVDVFEGPVPDRVHTDGHYIAPLEDRLVAGATYAPHHGEPIEPSPENTASNKACAEELLGQPVGAPLQSRAALRATTTDRHPIAGPLYDRQAALDAYAGLAKGVPTEYPPAPYDGHEYALTGLGSRGLVTAPLLAEHVAAQVTGSASPLTAQMAAIVHPGRFLIRGIKRGKITR